MQFVRYRKIWYLISLLVIIPGLISLATQGLNLGIDFKGGNMIDLEFSKSVPISELRQTVEDLNVNAQIQEAGEKNYLIRTTELSEEGSHKFIQGLENKFGEIKVNRNERVSGTIGKELTTNAIYALLIAGALMIVYITFRFEFLFGIAAVTALIHDVLITLGIFSLFQIEVDSTFIAALLTIIGYSINDTIVIFDRIRENLKLMKKEPVDHIVNVSISQTVIRSLTTGFTVIIGLVAILVFGGETTKILAIALLIGSVSGAYSSIFCASPFWYDVKTALENKKDHSHASAR